MKERDCKSRIPHGGSNPPLPTKQGILMSEFEDAVKYIIDNLEIDIDQVQEFGPEETIKVSLSLGGNVISESSCTLPKNNFD